MWLIPEREIGNETKQYIEIIEPKYDLETLDNAWFVDSGVEYIGEPVNSISNLGHLNGLEVEVFADGATNPRQIVADGTITLPDGKMASRILVGLPYSAQLDTLSPEFEGHDGSSMGRKKTAQEVIINVHKSGQMKIKSADAEEWSHYRKDGEVMGKPTSLSDESHSVVLRQGWSSKAEISIISDKPLPAVIKSINTRIEAEP